MTWKQTGRLSLATTLALGLSSCGTSNTVDYLYLLSAKNNPGQVNVYDVDAQTGNLKQISNSPYPAGRNPVGIAVLPGGKNLYVINHDDNTIIDYGIGTDAKLYPQHTYNTPGSEPVALAINAAGTLLFVVDYYGPLFTDENPGPGSITVFPIAGDGSLGTAASQALSPTQNTTYLPIGMHPSSVAVLPNGNTVYIAEQLAAPTSGCAAGQGAVLALSVSSAGALNSVAGGPVCAGVTPSAVVTDPAGAFVYVTDSTQNQLLGYAVQSDGSLLSSSAASAGTGNAPAGLTFDATGQFLYVANRNSNNIQGYTVTKGTGALTSNGTYATGPYPQCVIVEPNLNGYLYTADFQGIGSTGFKINPSTGVLSGTENSPYGGTGQATCLAATAHNKVGGGKGSA